jgi:repressor LexA
MLDFNKLTPRQKEIYDFIRNKIQTRGYGPTVREIGIAFDIQSPNGVMCHLKALVTKGFIDRQPNSARAIQLVDIQLNSPGLPIYGAVAAGSPVEAVENVEHLTLTGLFNGPDFYALKVRGQSMIEDHIDDGDFVVIRKKDSASNGERVVAMIDNEVTLKRFYAEDDHIRLEPANGEMESIIVPKGEAQILGTLAGVVRKC